MRRTRKAGNAVIGTVSAVALCSGAWLLSSGSASHPPPQPSAAQAARTPDTGRTGRATAPSTGEHGTAPLPPSPPDRVRIPAIGVDTPLMGLGLTRQGSLDVPPPERKNLAGWYEAGTTPGERGTAIVAGHVDNKEGPAVFYELGALRKGRTIEVERRDGSVAVFTVHANEVYDAADFPDEKVYGAASRPELRVITCGGKYSKQTGYQGNVVVFAHLTAVR
ncbi:MULTISPECIES: class F sortase [Streptomyces]|uniref:Class F sortase n=2 Tax=Streptomyces TaxID=1883 RepID=A0A5P2BCS9_STRVZ|nr:MULTISPECIES: class F sortase [Streptomyces]MYY82510.1 class F sortase [Streptomyces sp. SID335]MYZ15076.1 class F sortase [Streptomyces sp. SID337]NEB45096.1 class F sortase [Streptomyces sp. SID339]QES27011.1 class F sortase [Streptomyces venezuelae]